jgi:hypothetical protein
MVASPLMFPGAFLLLAGMMGFGVEVIAADSVGFKLPMLVREEGAMGEDLLML